MGYFVISRCEDEPSMEWFASKSDLLDAMLEEADVWEGDNAPTYTYIDNMDRIPDFERWPSYTKLVIKGEAVVPKPKEVEVVKSFDVD